MNTAARDRALLPTVKDVLGRTPVSKLKLTKEKDGSLKVLLHTSRPNNVRMETQALTDALKEQIGASRDSHASKSLPKPAPSRNTSARRRARRAW